MTEFTSLGVKAIRDGVAGGDFTAREVAEHFNAAVAEAASLNAFIVTTPDHALAAADAASERFNNPEPGEAEDEEVADEPPRRPQVVDVVTDLEGEAADTAADAESAAEAKGEQPSADVVQLPRAPH